MMSALSKRPESFLQSSRSGKDILLSNRKAIAGPLREVLDRITALSRILEAGDAEAAERFITAARDNLGRGGNDARSGGANPEIQAVSKETATKE